MNTKKILYTLLWAAPVSLIAYTIFFSPMNVFGRTLNLFEANTQRAAAAPLATYSLTEIPMIMSDASFGGVALNQVNGDGGGTITMRGQTFDKGFGVHATSVISFDLEGKCSSFSSYYGTDDSTLDPAQAGAYNGSVHFQVFADDEKVFQTPFLIVDDSRDSPYPPHNTGQIDLPDGTHELTLVVTNGGDNYYHDKANWGDPTVECTSQPNGDGSTFKHKRGSWEPVMDWPVKAIHAALLPSGHIISHASGDETAVANNLTTFNLTKVDLSDINTWSHEWVNNTEQEMYCSAHTLLPDGRLLEFGGHDGLVNEADGAFGKDQASIFDFETKTWEPQTSMHQARWYPTAVTLGNGNVLAIGGTHGINPGDNIFKPEVFDGVDWRILNNVDYSDKLVSNVPIFSHTYPYVHLVSDGRVFWSGWDRSMAYIDVTGNGQWGQSYQRDNIFRNWAAPIMYQQDKIMMIGGVAKADDNNPDILDLDGYATKTVQIIELTEGDPLSRPTNDMFFPRADADGTLLANGEVFMNGGSASHLLGDNPTKIFVSEIWNPETEEWRLGAQADKPRGYHSSSLLLPDGRVWTAGGECGDDCTDGMTAQVYNPPYLFEEDGSLATRPVLESVDAQINYAKPFGAQVSSNNGVSKVNLIRLGSTTHHFNFEQRFIELDFQQNGGSLTIDAPEHGNLAPPGFYMLFVLDDSGVPAIAKMVQIMPEEEETWELVESADESAPTARHESSYIELNDKFYLVGGRYGRQTQIFDPATKTWTDVGYPPQPFHHIQPIVYDGKIYIVGGFTGDYPNETSLANVYIFNPANNSWTTGPEIPEARRRGSAGTVVHDGKIYLVAGNNMGHNAGYKPWLDVFDPVAETWTILADAPRARDHFSAVVIDDKLYLAGGRQTDANDPDGPFDNTLAEVDIFDLVAGNWLTSTSNIPTERAGALTLAHGHELIVVGGESLSQQQAHAETQALNTNTGVWRTLPDLITGRHSGGALIWNDRIYTVSGAGERGGWPELLSQESLQLETLDGQVEPTSTPTMSPTSTPIPSGPGQILREAWTGIPGNQLADLTGSAKFAGEPDVTELLSSFEAPQNWGDNYGQQVRGYLHPPTTGLYEFWIASDDEAKLYLSTDGDPANKVEIGYMPDFADFRHFTKYPSQKSSLIMLEAGKKYYIEAIQKDGNGNDHLSVAWKAPGDSQEVIPGAYLSPFVGNVITPTPTATPENTPAPTATPLPSQTPTPATNNYSVYLPLVVR